jgi:hypothetical protein
MDGTYPATTAMEFMKNRGGNLMSGTIGVHGGLHDLYIEVDGQRILLAVAQAKEFIDGFKVSIAKAEKKNKPIVAKMKKAARKTRKTRKTRSRGGR